MVAEYSDESVDNQRETVAYWETQVRGWRQHAGAALDSTLRNSGWLAGNLGDVEAEVRRNLRCRASDTVPVNIFSLVARSFRGEMMFRAPRAMVKPLQGFGPSPFSPALAAVETRLLNDWTEEADFFGTGRKAIMDGYISYCMCVKVGYTADIAVDAEAVKAEREYAQLEDQKYLATGRKPIAKEIDDHRVHREQHEATVAAMERGDIKADKATIAYLKKHIKKHEEMGEGLPRSTETIRNERVYCRRVNPLRLVKDPWAENDSEVTWIGECFLRPLYEVHEDKRYDAEVRMQVPEVDFKHDSEALELRTVMQDSIKTEEKFCLIYEIVDLVERKVITYARGGVKPLRVMPYAMYDIFPSGPYIMASFMEDPITDLGIPLPTYIEAHQKAATMLATLSQIVARKSIPMKVYNSSAISAQELDDIKKAEPTGYIPVKGLISGQKIEDIFQQLPPVGIPEQNILMEDRHIRRIEQISGMGSAKLGGGDFSKTATASAITNESSSTISEDFMSVLDDWFTRVYRAVLRLMRRYYSPVLVGELVGEDALEVWPPEWAVRDIVQDKGASVIPGSSRRRNQAVEQKLLTDFYGILSADPMLPPNVKVEILKRLMESYGIYGIDLEGMNQMGNMALAGQLAGQVAPQGGPPAPRGSEASGEPGSMEAGMANVGGGRIPTGAGNGDKPRVDR